MILEACWLPSGVLINNQIEGRALGKATRKHPELKSLPKFIDVCYRSLILRPVDASDIIIQSVMSFLASLVCSPLRYKELRFASVVLRFAGNAHLMLRLVV